jgi:hypothetical protein
MKKRLIAVDNAGNKLYQENGKIALRNKRGRLVNKQDTKKFLQGIGIKSSIKNNKLYVDSESLRKGIMKLPQRKTKQRNQHWTKKLLPF